MITASSGLQMYAAQVGGYRAGGRRHVAEADQLGMVSITTGFPVKNRLSQQRLTPQRDQAARNNNKTRHVSSTSSAKKNNAVRSSTSRQQPERKVTSRTSERKNNAVHSSNSRQQPNRQVNSRSTNQKAKAYRGNSNRSSSPSSGQRNATLKNSNRNVSTTTRYNSKSDYRSPNRSVNAGKTHLDPKPRATQGNRNPHVVVNRDHNSHSNAHKRYYYPSKKVKMHVHPTTYHNHYRVMYYPAHREIIWTSRMHRYYVDLYPGYMWRYDIGYHIQTISAFETRYNVGEVARVYGRVYATWYNRESDDLLLFFGGEFPQQEFTMVIPGHIARRFNWRPERYFLGQHILATGLITSYDGSPEMIIKKKSQMDVY